MKLLLLILILLCCSCTSVETRKNQSIAAANIYHAALAIERNVNPAVVLPRIKSQALLILETNGDTLKGINYGD